MKVVLLQYRLVAGGIVLLGAAFSIAVAAILLTESSVQTGSGTDARRELRVEIIDELELYIEERNTSHEKPPRIPPEIFMRK